MAMVVDAEWQWLAECGQESAGWEEEDLVGSSFDVVASPWDLCVTTMTHHPHGGQHDYYDYTPPRIDPLFTQ